MEVIIVLRINAFIIINLFLDYDTEIFLNDDFQFLIFKQFFLF